MRTKPLVGLIASLLAGCGASPPPQEEMIPWSQVEARITAGIEGHFARRHAPCQVVRRVYSPEGTLNMVVVGWALSVYDTVMLGDTVLDPSTQPRPEGDRRLLNVPAEMRLAPVRLRRHDAGEFVVCAELEPVPPLPEAACAPERPAPPAFEQCDHLQPCVETIRQGQPVGDGCPMPTHDAYARCGLSTERVTRPVDCAAIASCVLVERGGLKPGLGCPAEGSSLYDACREWQPAAPRAQRARRRRGR